MPKCGGVYISKLPVDYGAMLSYSYLRFYEDGTVIESSIRGERSTEIMSWFDKSDSSISNGNYEVDGRSLQFSVTSDSGSVDYGGRIVDGELHLHSVSQINGNEADDEYEFFGAIESAAGVVKPYLRRDPVPQNRIHGNQPVPRSIEAVSQPSLAADRHLNEPTVAVQVRFCPTCGKQAQPADMFCAGDGTPLPR